MVAIWVDNILAEAENDKTIAQFERNLLKWFERVRITNAESSYLETKKNTTCQKGYINDILEWFGMAESKLVVIVLDLQI